MIHFSTNLPISFHNPCIFLHILCFFLLLLAFLAEDGMCFFRVPSGLPVRSPSNAVVRATRTVVCRTASSFSSLCASLKNEECCVGQRRALHRPSECTSFGIAVHCLFHRSRSALLCRCLFGVIVCLCEDVWGWHCVSFRVRTYKYIPLDAQSRMRHSAVWKICCIFAAT